MAIEISLNELPKPEIIEEIDIESLLENNKNKLLSLLNEPEHAELKDTINIESGPIITLLETAAYQEYLLREKSNALYRASLLFFSQGNDLDYVADLHGVDRLEGESDEDLRQRTRIYNRGSSSAGPDDWWRFHAMQADELVEDVAVSRSQFPIPGPGEKRGEITLSILAQTDDGIPTQEMLGNVRAHVTSTSVRGATTDVNVVAATSRDFDIVADITMLEDSQEFVFAGLEQKLRDAWAQSRALGFDIEPSWIISVLQAEGVKSVDLISPIETIEIAFNEAPVINTITLNRID